MQKFFKGEELEKPSFNYPIITDIRKGSNNYIIWIIGLLVVIIIGVVIFIFR